MRILYDHQIFQEQTFGGISRYFTELASRLGEKKSGQKVWVSAGLLYRTLYLDRKKTGAHTHIVGWRSGARIRRGRKLTHCAAVLTTRLVDALQAFDIVHPTYYDLPAVKPSRKVVATYHDFIQERFPEINAFDPRVVPMKRALAVRADHIITISDFTRQCFLRQYPDISPDKVTTVHLASSLVANSAALLPLAPELTAKPYLLFVGNRRLYKSFSTLVSALQKSGDLKEEFAVVCVGGETPDANELSSGLTLHFIKAHDDLLVSLYKNAFALVVPSLCEGFGLPVVEAMSLGCPVISAQGSSLTEIAGGASLEFVPGDRDSLLNAIRVMAESDRSRWIEKGRVRARDFSWDKCAGETLAVYKKVASGS